MLRYQQLINAYRWLEEMCARRGLGWTEDWSGLHIEQRR
jgi:hypothetical protein